MVQLREFASAARQVPSWVAGCAMLLVLALFDRIKNCIKSEQLRFLRTSTSFRATLMVAFILAVGSALETQCAGISQVLVALWFVAAAACLALAMIPPRSREPLARDLYVVVHSTIEWTSAYLETPRHPPAR